MAEFTNLPTPPSTADPSNFDTRADAFLGALPAFQSELNQFAADLNNISTSSISSTSLTISVGSKTLTVDTGKSYYVGMSVKIAVTADGTKWMIGDVTSYSSLTGELIVSVDAIKGSGTYSGWTVTLSFNGQIQKEQIPENEIPNDKLALDVRRPITGLVVTNNLSDLEHDIDISAGAYNGFILSSGLTKQLDATFAEGDGNGGMIGTLPTSGVVYIFLIVKDSDGSIDVYAETTDGTSPPGGWTIIKRIAVRITDESSNLQRVIVSGNGERLTVYPYTDALDWNVNTVPTSRTAYPISSMLRCPPNTNAMVSQYLSSSNTTLILISSLLAEDVEPTGQVVDLISFTSSTQVQVSKLVFVDSNRQIGARRGGPDVSSSYSARIIYWIEDRS